MTSKAPESDDEKPGYWNYRVISQGGYLTIHEVHYHGDGSPYACTERPAYPAGETLEELRDDIRRYSSALELPVLPGELFEPKKDA